MQIINTWAVVAAVVVVVYVEPTFARLGLDDRKLKRPAPDAKIIPNQYIVVFEATVARADINTTANTLVNDLPDGTLRDTYSTAIQGFVVSNVADPMLLLQNGAVASVFPDTVVTVSTKQVNPTWGLDRIDESDLPLDGVYNYNCNGLGVYAYVIDTGIRLTHQEFGGRATCGAFFVETSCNDGHGHGTHVAGTIGGATYGVAKGINVVSVKVLDSTGSGYSSTVLSGLDFVASQKTQNPSRKMVVNISLGGSVDPLLDQAVTNLVGMGVAVVVAAGNANGDACNSSPSRATAAVTAGAIDKNDVRSDFSNYGACVDVFAPGSSITSAWIGSDTATNIISGTSMASPHVAGVVSQYLQAGRSVQDMLSNALAGKIGEVGNLSPNLLVTNQFVTCVPVPAPTPISPQCLASKKVCSNNSQCCSKACKNKSCK